MTDTASAEDFEMTYELNPVIRRFVVQNDTLYTLKASFTIIPKSNEFLNFRIPSSTITATIKPKGVTCILSIMKIYPEMAWGEYETNMELIKDTK